jgi:hypothetical protein
MKKSVFFAALILALLASLFGTSVMASRTTTNNLTVVNNTNPGTSISMMFETGGKQIWKVAGFPSSTFALTPAIYSYKAITVCGTAYGTINMSQARILRFQCVEGKLKVVLAR